MSCLYSAVLSPGVSRGSTVYPKSLGSGSRDKLIHLQGWLALTLTFYPLSIPHNKRLVVTKTLSSFVDKVWLGDNFNSPLPSLIKFPGALYNATFDVLLLY